MASTTATTLEHYLATTYSPDVEYINGKLKERNVGSYEHAGSSIPKPSWARPGPHPISATGDTLIVRETHITLHLPTLFASLKSSQHPSPFISRPT